MTNSSASLSFGRRGLPGLLLIAIGITLSIVFRKSSTWPTGTQHVVFPLALVLAVGGSVLFSSFVRQRPLRTRKLEIASAALIVVLLLIGKPS